MATDSGKKLFVGPRFRRIRQQLGLSQTQIAEGLGISPSYINLIERNQRPVTAQILLRLAETSDLDLRDLATADEDRFFAELNEIFSDPLFRQIDLPKQELRDLAELCPGVTHSLQRLYAAYTEARRGETLVAAQMADRDEGTRFEANPIERVRDLIEANRNYPLAHFALGAALALLGSQDDAKAATKPGLLLDPTFTVRRYRLNPQSDDPTYLARRERVAEGLRMAGVPDG